jgi:hypothetical protein
VWCIAVQGIILQLSERSSPRRLAQKYVDDL